MRIVMFAIAAAVISGTAAWFGALQYAAWRASEARVAAWSALSGRCYDLKVQILSCIRDPARSIHPDPFPFAGGGNSYYGPDGTHAFLDNWQRCRGQGFISPADEMAAFVERHRRAGMIVEDLRLTCTFTASTSTLFDAEANSWRDYPISSRRAPCLLGAIRPMQTGPSKRVGLRSGLQSWNVHGATPGLQCRRQTT